MPIALDTGVTDQHERIPGDFRRNSLGRPWVANPAGRGRDLLYHRPSGLWPFDSYVGIDPIYSQRGTHTHTLCDYADRGESLTDEFLEAGDELGMTPELQAYVYARWLVFRKAHGITTVHIEQPVVNDVWRVAGTRDRVDAIDGVNFTGDIKTGSNVTKAAYAVQLVAYAHGTPYDCDNDTRLDHVDTDTGRGFIYHFPLTAAVKADTRDGWPDWSLVVVDLDIGRDLGERLVELRDDETHADAFRAIDTPDDTVTLDDARARYATLSDGDRQALEVYWNEHGTDRTDAEQIMASIDAVVAFHDVQTERAERPKSEPLVVTPPKVLDEGVDLDEATIVAAGKRYMALPDDVRPWVTVSGANIRLKAEAGGKPTERRMELLRGLCTLAEFGYDNDDMARAVMAHVIGDEVWQGATVADLLGQLDLGDARLFASICDALAGHANVALHYQLDGRAVLSPSLGGAA